MQLLEKVQELQAIQPPLDPTEMNRRIAEWKKQTNYKAPEAIEVEEVKIQDSPEIKDPIEESQNNTGSEALDSGSGLSPSKKYNFLDLLKPKDNFNFGFSQPEFDKDYFNRKYKSLTGYDIDDLEPDEIFEGEGGYEYKYNLGESKDGKAPMNFYMKKPGEEGFIDLTTKYNKILKEDPEFKIEENIEFANSYASILSEMGYLPEDVKKDVIAQQEKIKKKNAEIKAFNEKQDTSRLYNERGLENYNNRTSLNQAPNFYRIEEGETTVPEFFNMSAPTVESYENYIKTSEMAGFMYGLDGATAKDKALALVEYEDLDLDFPFLYFKNSQKEDSQLKGYDQNLLIEEFGGVKGLEQIGVNSDDFLGFLLYKGFAGDIVDAKESGKFKDEPLMFQRQMQDYVNFYMQEMDHRYNTKQKMLDVIYDKDGKYEEYNITSSTSRAMALKLPEYGKSEAKTIFDYGAYEAYASVLFPDAFAKDQEYLAKKIKFNNTLDNRDDAASKLYATAEGLKNIPVAFYEEAWGLKNWVSDIVGADDIADRGRGRLAEINRRRASYQTYANFYGPTLEIEGTTYAIDRDDENETLWNVDEGYSVVGDASYIQKLTERVKKEGKVENHKNTRGILTQGGTVFGSLLLQVVGTKGFGTASKGLRLTTGAALNGFGLNVAKYKRYKDLATAIGGSPTSKLKLPIKTSTIDNIMFQGMYGAYTGHETILSESLANGLNQEEAQELANTGSLAYSTWYAATGPINNKGGWFDDIIGKRTLQNTVKRAIGKYKSEGYNGFMNSFQKSLLKLSAKASKFVEQGLGETVQENTQQSGEALINRYLNYKFDVGFLDDTYTKAEVETTSGLSFVTAGIMSGIKMPNFKGNSKNNLLDYQYIGENATEAEKIALQLVESGLATQQDVADMLENAKAVTNQTPRIPKWLDNNLTFDVAKLMQERQNLENSKKNIDKSFHQNIDDRIENINLEIDGYVRPAADAQRAKLQTGVENFLNKVRKAKGNVDMVSFDTTAEANAYRQELLEQGGNVMQSDNYGDMVITQEGNKVLIVDNQINTEDNIVTTGVHEGGHFVLSETVNQDPDAAKKLGNALVDEMFENENVTITNNDINRRLAKYASQGVTTPVMMEEIMMMVSEALINGDIEFNETSKTKIGDLIRRTLQDVFGIKIKFKDGKSVLNFLRDYNRTIETQRGGKAIARVSTEGAQVDISDPGIEAARKVGRVTQEVDPETGEIVETEIVPKPEVEAKQSQRIDETKETPEQAIENKELMNKIVEGDISAAGTLVQKNSGLILGPDLLNFNPDITAQSGVTSEDVLQAVTDMMTPGIVDIVFTKEKTGEQRNKSLAEEYTQEKGEVSTFLGRLRFRKKEIYTAAGLDPNKFNLVDIDSSTKQIADEGSDPKPRPEKEVATTQVDPREFGPVTEGNKLKDVEGIVKVNDKERLTFKKLASKYFDKVSQALFSMPGKKVKGNASLKYANVKGQPSSSEASKLQNVFKNVEDVRSFIKAMPPYNVATSQTVIDRQGKKIDVSKDIRGRSIAINPTILKKFYQPVTRAIEGISNESGRSLGSTSQTQVYELKPEYRGRITKATIEGLQKSLGITKGELSVPIKGPARTEFGSLLTGLSKMYVDNLINTVGRSKLTTDQAKADTGAGKSNVLASQRIDNVFQAATSGTDALGFNRFNYEYGKVIPQLLKGEKVIVKDKDGKDIEVDTKPFDMKTPEGVKRFLDYAISSGITKRVPRELWISLAFRSENLLKDTTKKYGEQVKETRRLLESLQEDPSDNVFGEIEGAVISPTTGVPRGYAGNLPFRSTIEARQWITDSIDAEYNRLKNDKDLNLTDAEARKQADALFPKKGSSEFSNLFIKTDVFTNKNNLETQLDDPAFVKSQDAKINELKKFFKLLQNEVMRDANNNIDFEGVAFVGAMLSSSSAGTSHFLRNAAPMRFYQEGYRDPDIGGSSNVTIEHTMPATLVGKYLFMAAVEGDVDTKFKTIKDNYVQGPLLEVDDKKLKGKKANGESFDYREQMPDFWQDTDSVWGRYFNLNVIRNGGGINPATIMFGKGDSALSRFNVMADGTVINNTTKKGLPAVEKQNNSSLPNALASKRKLSTQQQISQQSTLDNALSMGRRTAPPIKKIRIFDFDDTLARSKSMVIVNMPFLDAKNEMVDVVARRMFKDEFKNLPSYKQTFKSLNADQQRQVLQSIPGETIKINATEFAQQAADLESIGATFDFTEFSKVVEGQKGPLFDVAKKIADARGTEDLFILTARPQEAAGPIRKFMKALGINIPLANITGLADGTAQAKAMWVADKAAQGYNDFYFADDAIKNVKAVKEVLGQIDVKSKVQQAKASKRRTFDNIVNDMIEDSSGIESFKKFSSAKARTVGRDKGRFDWLTMASSAEDFKGLLYSLIGRGKKGEAQYEFLKTNLIDTYNRAEDTIIQAKVSAANDFMALKEQFPGLPKTLETETGVGKFTYQHALRAYIWTQQGMSIPGLSKTDIKKLNNFIADDPKLKSFADGLIGIQKGKPYPKPGKEWLGGNLTTDIIGGINKVNRKEYQQEWQENVDIIFSPENLNKMEAAYGTRWRKALENSLARMKAGTNRLGYTDSSNAVLDWVNNSVGAVMFLNTRSALLQTISAVNFLNWGDNNIIKAGAAFANQPQYWADFMKLMNSDYLVQRRNGLKINVSESEIADAVKDSQNKPKAAIAFLLSKGFVFTRYADSFAIATGGATFYRNRIKKYLKEGMDQKLAEQKAFEDFKDVAEESQQSSDPSKISMQQASGAGRVILNWANTPMQYVRIQKRALQDLIAGRGDAKVHISRIAYYGVIQNLIFNALQQALFAIGFGDDDEEEDPKKKARNDKKIARVANGMIDSQLKGLGIAGMGMVSVKNTLMKIYEESGKKRPEYEAAAIEALSFSPAISSKYRKFVGGLKSFSWNMKEMKEKGFSLDNPAYLAGAQIVTAFTNLPIDRVMKKANNIRGILSEQSQMWQKVSMALGYSSYDVGLPYYGGWDKPVEPTPAEIKRQEFDIMKKDTKTQEQIDMLLDLGLNKKEIKALGKEDNRVKKIIELQNKPKEKPAEVKTQSESETKPEPKPKPKPKTETAEQKLRRQFDSIKSENKPDQVKTLTKFGLTKKEIRDLRYEKTRVEKILELMDK
jgi:hypothetical protein